MVSPPEDDFLSSPDSDWYRLETDQVLDRLGVDPAQGLDPSEVETRRRVHGSNEIQGAVGRGPGKILRQQILEPMVILLLVAAGISFAVHETTDAVAILVIVALNSLLGFIQDFRAEKAMAKLKELAMPEVTVRREGRVLTLPARELVPGDIIGLEAGNRISADCRLIETRSLHTLEAALTGESQQVAKDTLAISEKSPPLGDRHNLVFMGTDVVSGRGEAVVTGTGMKTELGNIAGMIQAAGEKRTPLQRRLARLGIRLAIAALGIVAVVFAMGIFRGQDMNLMIMTALSMAVAAVPEGLPAVATISLALGARRMLRRNALIRRLPAVETLGSVTVICSDKTGTLTANRMEVISLWSPDGSSELGEKLSAGCAPILRVGALCNDAELGIESDATETHGDPTELALVAAAAESGLDQRDLISRLPRVGEAPFDSHRKRMTTIHACDEGCASLPGFPTPSDLESPGERRLSVALMKGAAEAVLSCCDSVAIGGRIEPLTESRLRSVREADDHLASRGQRVLGFAFRWLKADSPEAGPEPDPAALEQGFIFLGLVGMQDPPRPESRDAVARCRSAGIRPIMITGDHPRTAHVIAREIGISGEENPVGGRTLETMSDEQLAETVSDTSVYARVSPEHKLRIVNALQEGGDVVAMTGDGVNDAPALKKADIGVAMGITGTDVSKEAAETVLLDDDFATIVDSVEEGRTIYDNICKFLKYTLTSNTGEIVVMLAAPFLGMPLPLIPLQILWINLVTDGFPGLALAVEPAERNVMQRPPRDPNEPILTRSLIRHLLVIGTLMGAVSLGVGYVCWSGNPTTEYDPSWGTMIFTVLTLSQMGHALAIRSTRDSLFAIGILSNPALLAAIGLTLLLQLAVIYLPWLQSVFQTVPLSLGELGICLLLSTAVFWAVEGEKWFTRRRELPGIE